MIRRGGQTTTTRSYSPPPPAPSPAPSLRRDQVVLRAPRGLERGLVDQARLADADRELDQDRPAAAADQPQPAPPGEGGAECGQGGVALNPGRQGRPPSGRAWRRCRGPPRGR